jgi:formylglycine-generating enzyme required for sulfatase activity
VWGLYDMHGNVWEWCADDWDEDAYKKRVDGAVIAPRSERQSSGEQDQPRVLRGGSWNFAARFCRAAVRDGPPAAKKSAKRRKFF